ncbi:MAG: ATP-grasp domain-containing protein [Planctomycetes bacterium]|nr:ATP-grasp domain-containing protein [Planctomycetota bacterium]
MPALDKVLVANRGEIAVRVIRALRETGRKAVAVYSEADRDALHVRLADEAVCIGPPAPAQSYLDVHKVIDAARRTGAQGVHPGYGFISERAPAARAIEDAGLVWIGPSPTATAQLDDKIEARKVAHAAGVPTIPGSDGAISPADARALALEVGLPVLLKAAGGGGGKGIRLVRDAATLEADLARAAGEAQSAFGTGVIYLEKCVSPARHIEVQVLGDGRGKAIHLGERECSLQRRQQKVVEETPSLALSADVRERLCRAAVAVVERVHYRGAGTVEFLLDREQRFYFLEVNKRLQVEHPITEAVTGVDLVRAQLDIAETGRLPLGQEDWQPRGHAIQLRVNAEDPWQGFAPSVGRVAGLRLPSGPFVRVDTALFEGAEVTPHYDSLLAKLIVWGRDRDEATSRWAAAARAFHVGGVRTTLPLAPLLAEDEEFRRFRFDTEWLLPWVERARAAAGALSPAEAEAVAVAAALATHRAARRGAPRNDGQAGPSPWVLLGRREALGG